MNFHEPLEIKCNFQRPSSSDSPLTQRDFLIMIPAFNIPPFGKTLNHCAKLKSKLWNLFGFSWLIMAEVDTVVTEGPLASLVSLISSTEVTNETTTTEDPILSIPIIKVCD